MTSGIMWIPELKDHLNSGQCLLKIGPDHDLCKKAGADLVRTITSTYIVMYSGIFSTPSCKKIQCALPKYAFESEGKLVFTLKYYCKLCVTKKKRRL